KGMMSHPCRASALALAKIANVAGGFRAVARRERDGTDASDAGPMGQRIASRRADPWFDRFLGADYHWPPCIWAARWFRRRAGSGPHGTLIKDATPHGHFARTPAEDHRQLSEAREGHGFRRGPDRPPH